MARESQTSRADDTAGPVASMSGHLYELVAAPTAAATAAMVSIAQSSFSEQRESR
jgi:hypothetical protein